MGINFDNLNREGCMRSMQQQLGILGTIWHLLEDRGKPKQTCVEMAGRRGPSRII